MSDGLEGSGVHVALMSSTRRFRGVFAGQVVFDSVRGVLAYEPGCAPVVYVPREDVRLELLERSQRSTRSATLGAARRYSLRVGERVALDAAWDHPEPPAGADGLRDRIAFGWEALDAWFEEDAPAYGHVRDPFHRVDVLASSRHVRVECEGVVLAESRRPRLLFETGCVVRAYLPRADVRMHQLTPAEGHTVCPYKGVASYLTATIAGTARANVAWVYPTPLVECMEIENLVCFDEQRVLVLLDGAAQPSVPWGAP